MNVILRPAQSVLVSYGAPNSNYDSFDVLRAGVQSDTSTRYMTLLQFDLSCVPPHSIINSALLELYSYSDLCWQSTSTILAQRITQAWNEATATYNSTKDHVTSVNQGSGTNGGYNTWYDYNIAGIAQDWSNGANNYGIWLIQSDLTVERGKAFYKNGDYRPKLTIDYTPVGMRANVNGTWKNCLAYAKDGGTWKLCKTHAKANDTWKQCR